MHRMVINWKRWIVPQRPFSFSFLAARLALASSGDLAVGTDVGEQRNRALMATTREIYVRERIASGAGWIIRMILGERFNCTIVLLSVKRKMNVPLACVNIEILSPRIYNLYTFAYCTAVFESHLLYSVER